jgi:glycosyltransferase involved in cell wall biosynthesis
MQPAEGAPPETKLPSAEQNRRIGKGYASHKRKLKIVIMMLTLNSAEFFRVGVLSALKEAAKNYNYKLLVVDGGSKDRTVRMICKEFGNRAKVIVFKERNLALCRNLALEKAPRNADFYSWVDSDILVPKNFFSRLIPLFKDRRIGTAEIRALLGHRGSETLVSKYYKQLKIARESGVREGEGGATTCMVMRPRVAMNVKMDPRFRRAGEDVSLHYQANEMNYKTVADLNEPSAWHVRNPSFTEEMRRLVHRGEARVLNIKLHRKVVKTAGLRKAVLSSILTLACWALLIYGFLAAFIPALVFFTIPLGRFSQIGTLIWPFLPFILLIARHSLKLKKRRLLHLAMTGLILSTAYLIGVLRGLLKN